MLLHQGCTFAHHVVVATLLVAERLLQLLGVLAGLFETRLDFGEARLCLLLLLDDLDCGLPLAPARELAGLTLLDGQGLLLCDSVVGEHLLVGHRAGRRDLELLQVLELILDGVLKQYLRVALLDPGEKPPEETANSPRKIFPSAPPTPGSRHACKVRRGLYHRYVEPPAGVSARSALRASLISISASPISDLALPRTTNRYQRQSDDSYLAAL